VRKRGEKERRIKKQITYLEEDKKLLKFQSLFPSYCSMPIIRKVSDI